MSKSHSNRSGVAMAALARNSAGPMRHRLQPRGGSQKLDLDYGEEDDYEPRSERRVHHENIE